MKNTDKVTSSQIKLAVGGIRFDRDIRGTLEMGWSISPSIGLVAKDIEKLGLKLEDLREPITKSIKKVMIPSIRRNFDVGGRPAWDALADYTVNVRGDDGPILVRTGKLKHGATQFGIWTITDTSASIRSLPSSIWYGAIHQAGSGGFGEYITKAKASLGRKASSRDVLKHAFELLDAARGGARGHRSVTIPQRQFIMYQEDDIDDIQEIFYRWVVEQTIKVGRFVK